jgi:Protein of unknown function (DUF3102)
VRGGEGLAAGPDEDAAADEGARHGAGPDRLESSNRPEGGDGDAPPDGGSRVTAAADEAGARTEALTGEVIPPAAATNGRRAPSPDEASELAARINAAHDELVQGLRTTVERAVALGRLLLEAKARFGHGRWLAWLEAATPIRRRTAAIYMELATALPGFDAQERKRISNSGVAGALAEIRRRRREGKEAGRAQVRPERPERAGDPAREQQASALDQMPVERPHRPAKTASTRATGDGPTRRASQSPTPAPRQPPGGCLEPPPTAVVVAPAADGSARPPGIPRSGQELFQAIVAIRNESDEGALERLKELRSLERHSGRRLELLDAHVAAQAYFLAGLRSLRERLGREAAAKEAGA